MTHASQGFLAVLTDRAAAGPRRIALPEATDPRVLEAARVALDRGCFHPVLYGDPETIRSQVASAGADADRLEVVDTTVPGAEDRLAIRLADLGKEGKGLAGTDPLVFAALDLAAGAVDGVVAGCVRTTADVVRVGLNVIGLREGADTVSSCFLMVFDDDRPVLTFADAGVVPTPTVDQLATIARSAASAHVALVAEEPRVAFLSFATHESAGGPEVERVREALERFRDVAPEVVADGPLQADSALVPSIAERKAPGSPVLGEANVLVFPDLDAANIAYKLVQHLAGATALGPILLNFAQPMNDLSRGATASDIVGMGCVTALLSRPAADP